MAEQNIPKTREEIAAYLGARFDYTDEPIDPDDIKWRMDVYKTKHGSRDSLARAWLGTADLVLSWLTAAREEGRRAGLEEIGSRCPKCGEPCLDCERTEARDKWESRYLGAQG